MKKEIINSKKAPAAIGPYSQAVRAGDTLYFAGQIPLDPATMEIVPGGIKEQAERVLLNIKAILEEAGLGFDSVVKSTVYMANLADFAEMNKVYEKFFGTNKPARVTIQVAALPKAALVEIDVIAVY